MFFRPLLKRIDWLHAWFGVTAGVLVLVISWTGTIAVFQDVLRIWERTEYPVAEAGARIDVDAEVREAIASHFGNAQPVQLLAFLPSRIDPNLTLSASAAGMPSLNIIIAPGGDRVAIPGPGPGQLITELHTDLLLPAPFGIWVVGFSGIVALVLIVTGILLHRQIIRDLFALRLFRSRRIALHDIHTIVGTWSLPFFFLLCFSGAVLGFITIANAMVEQVTNDGETVLAAEESSPSSPSVGGPARTVNLNAVIGSVRTLERPFEPEAIQVDGWGGASAVITVRGEPTDQLVWRRRATFDGVSGELLMADLDSVNAPPLAAYAMMVPIHYGNFGGLFVQSLYFAVGVIVTFAMGVGLILWINKRGNQHRWLSKAAIGLTAGCLVATALVFPLDLWLRFMPENRLAWLEVSLWASWLATFLLTLAGRSWAGGLIAALVSCAILFAGAGLISAIGVLANGETGPPVFSTTVLVNAVLIGLGALCWYCAKWTRLTVEATAEANRALVSAAS